MPIDRVNDIDRTKIRPRRAGIILYVRNKNGRLFCLGEDYRTGELTDFGGGVKKCEDAITGAIRELREEILDVICPQDFIIYSSIAVYNNSMMIIFVFMDVDPDVCLTTFNQKLTLTENPEVKNLIWLTEEQFKLEIESKKGNLYEKVRNLLKSHKHIFELL